MDDLEIARTSPRARRWQMNFWRAHWGLVGFIVFGVALGHWIAPFVAGEASTRASTIIVVVILALLLQSLRTTLDILSTLDVNQAIARHIRERGQRLLLSWQDKAEARLSLEAAAQSIRPSNPSEPDVLRMFDRIIAEAKDRQFSHGATVAAPYRDQISAKLMLLERYQQLALRFGILGTFLGLAGAVHTMPSALNKLMPAANAAISTQELRDSLIQGRDSFVNLGQAFAGHLGDAFGTSIAGLTAAGIIAPLVVWLRGRIHQYFESMELCAAVTASVARNAIINDELPQLLDKMARKFEEMRDQVYSKVTLMERATVEQAGIMGASLDKLHEAAKTMHNGVVEMGRQQKKLVETLEERLASSAINSLFGKLEHHVASAGREFAGGVRDGVASIGGQVASLESGIQKVQLQLAEGARVIQQESQRIGNSLEKVGETLTTSMIPAAAATEDLSKLDSVNRTRKASQVLMVLLGGMGGGVAALVLSRLMS